MISIQYCSDLHLEFFENEVFLKENPIQPKAETLILAGDVIPFTHLQKFKKFFDGLSKNFKQVYWIPGNHEYYHANINKWSGSFCEPIRKNVFLLNNYVVRLGTIRLLFTTLWTHISDKNAWEIQHGLSDFRVIKRDSHQIKKQDYNELHRQSLVFLESSLKKSTDLETTIVVTHHVPTFMHYPEKYRGDVLNEAFAVELFDFIETNEINYWIFGHHHCNIPEFNIGNTKLLTNQLGYVQCGEHIGFDNGKILKK